MGKGIVVERCLSEHLSKAEKDKMAELVQRFFAHYDRMGPWDLHRAWTRLGRGWI